MKRVRYMFFWSLAFTAIVAASSVAVYKPALAASNSLGVNPRRDYTIKPGDKISDTLNVSNLSKTEPLLLDIKLVDFGPKNETGLPALLLDRKEPTPWSLKPYLTIANSLRIEPGKSVQLPFTIAIPTNLGAGSYYGAIKYSTSGEGSNNNVSLTSSSATLVFVRVPGAAKDALVLKDFGPFTPNASGDSGEFGKLYIGQAPRFLSYRLANLGNVAEQPSGSIVLKDMFGKQVKLLEKANPNNNIVLLGQTRRIDRCINENSVSRQEPSSGGSAEPAKCTEPKLQPGRYTAEISLVYGDDGGTAGGTSHELRRATSFWYLPAWSIAVAAAVPILGIFVWLAIRALSGRRRLYRR